MQIITGRIQAAQKIVVFGPEGIGKSTFAAQFPRPLFIDTEGSTKGMDVARTPKPTSWPMLMEQVRYVRDNPHICGTLVIDTADWAEQLCVVHICSKKADVIGIEDFGYGKGYTYLAEEFGRLLNALEEVVERGIHVAITAHAQMRKFEQPDEMGAYDRWEMKLQKKTAPLLKEWADMVLFANYKTLVVNVDNQGASKGKNKAQGGKRVMYTAHHPCWDAKNRHDLALELKFDYAEIAHCIQPVHAAPSAPIKIPAPPAAGTTAETPSLPPPSQTGSPAPVQTIMQSAPPDPPPAIIKEANGPPLAQPVREPPPPGIPKALYDLMEENNVLEVEIRTAVANEGYFPLDTPIPKYPPEFIEGCLIGAWPEALEKIMLIREKIQF